jgi:hypothetical protein
MVRGLQRGDSFAQKLEPLGRNISGLQRKASEDDIDIASNEIGGECRKACSTSSLGCFHALLGQ